MDPAGTGDREGARAEHGPEPLVADPARDPRQRGFTLIEASIVLVVVGMIVGGSIVAREMMHVANVKGLATDFTHARTALAAYQDAHRALPGDDATAAIRIPGAVSLAGPAVANGVIDGPWLSTNPADESLVAWQHLRLAHLSNGPTDLASPGFAPLNRLGGRFGMSSATPAQLQVAGMRGSFQACSASISGRMAKQLIISLGQGNADTPEAKAVPDGSPPGTTPTLVASLEDGTAYTVCMVF